LFFSGIVAKAQLFAMALGLMAAITTQLIRVVGTTVLITEVLTARAQ
jgi:hypothetical protein